MKFKTKTLGALSIAAITLPIASVVACSPTEDVDASHPAAVLQMSEIKDHSNLGTRSVPVQAKRTYGFETDDSGGFDKLQILNKDSYNSLYTEMTGIPDSVAIVFIANHHAYSDIVKINYKETVLKAINDSKFILKTKNFVGLGEFGHTFALKSDPTNFMHGTNPQKSSGDYYFMYYINHKSSQLGISNYKLHGHEMLEFTYDVA